MAKKRTTGGKKGQKRQHKKKKISSTKSALEKVLAQQTTILKNEKSIQQEERKIQKKEAVIESLEKNEVQLEQQSLIAEQKELEGQASETKELEKLEALEKEIKSEVMPHPLTKVTLKDFVKGIIGAFVGVVVHFTFIYGVKIAEYITITRATFLLFFTLFIGAGFLYGTGFRNIKDKSVIWLLPYRLIVLYSTAIIVTTTTLAFFYPHFFENFDLAFRQIAVVNLSAVVGACTADLIGRE